MDFAQSLKESDKNDWTKPIEGGKWSTREIIGHILYWDILSVETMLPLMSNGATLPAFPNLNEHNNRSVSFIEKFITKDDLIDIFISTRKELIIKSKEIYNKNTRFTIGKGKRKYSIDSYISIFVDHDKHHKKQVEDFMEQL